MADIITYPENGITYDADDASGFLSTRLSGVYSAEEDFSVTAQGGLNVQVSAGQAWVHPARFKGRSIIMEQPTTVVLTEADPVRSRIDRIVLRYDAAAKKTRLQVLDGTPDSAAPAAPEISCTELVYDLCLAEIRRPAGSTSVTAADITDTRADEAICGVMRDGVTGIPTAQLQAQVKAMLDSLQAEVDSRSFYTRAEVDALLKSVNPFPVGSIYQSTDPTSPAALFGGTWEQIASERVLMGASSSHAAGTTVKAGLPNITGSFVADVKKGEHKVSGAFTAGNVIASTGEYNSFSDVYKFSLDASKSNAIYGRSATVQPAAYYVHIWRRVA
jgi:hypothetical protein|nr:MAG TPA: Receptor Binding Protein [Caudoviricetes sp.]